MGATTGFALGSGASLFAGAAELIGLSIAGQAGAGAFGASQGALVGNIVAQTIFTKDINLKEVAATTLVAAPLGAAGAALGGGVATEVALGIAGMPIDIFSGTLTSERKQNACGPR